MSDPAPLVSSTRPVNPELAALLGRLQPGARIRITQTVRGSGNLGGGSGNWNNQGVWSADVNGSGLTLVVTRDWSS